MSDSILSAKYFVQTDTVDIGNDERNETAKQKRS